MSLSSWLKMVVLIAVVALILPNTYPVHAATAAIGQFYAGCGNFSVDVTVMGQNDDGNHVDRFRYQVIDGNNKVLYQEDATRPDGITNGSLVVNLPYQNIPATANPIQFLVIELDGSGNAGAAVAGASYMAPCLPANGSANRSGIFAPPKIVTGTILGDTPLYQGPGINATGLVAHAGNTLQVIYRTPDSAWVSVFVGGNDLVWIPASAINANIAQLALQPTHIDGSSPSIPGSGGSASSAAPAPTGQTAVTLADLRLHSAPTAALSNVVKVIPSGTTLSVLGMSPDGAFVQVNYNGTVGWVAASFVRVGPASGAGTAAASATGITAVTLSDIRLHSSPVLNLTNVVAVVPFGTVVPVVGRSADNQLVKITFNGTAGWVASGFVRIVGSRVAALPIVQ